MGLLLCVLKPPAKRYEHDLAQEFRKALRGLLTQVPFLKLETMQADASLRRHFKEHSGMAVSRPDWLVKLKAGTRQWTLLAETKVSGQPREVRNGLLQLNHYLSMLPPRTHGYGVILAPFISEASARLCAEAGIGYADLAGNARLSFDQVFIESRVAENPFYEKREVKSMFSPKAARVLRVLLQGPLRPWKVQELASAADVSLGHVSAVRKQLLANEWARDEDAGIRIANPNAILDAWAAADRWEARTTVREYSLLVNDPLEIAVKLHEVLGHRRHAFTQWVAAALRQPHTATPVTTAYVADFPEDALLKDTLLARRVDSGGRLRLILPSDGGVFNPVQTVHGLPLVSDVQLYLDLQRAGLRSDEAAAELRKWPGFAGGWA